MQTLAGLLKTVQEAGYRCLSHTPLPMSAWNNYLDPSSAIWRVIAELGT